MSENGHVDNEAILAGEDAEGVKSVLFNNGSARALWGGLCAFVGNGCIQQIADTLADKSFDRTLSDAQRTDYLHYAFFVRSDLCFDNADEWRYDSRTLALLLCGNVPAFTPNFLGIFTQAPQRLGDAQVVVRRPVKVTILGMHASYLLEIRHMWDRYVSEPLSFEFTEISIDRGRCKDAGCALEQTSHPVFLQLLQKMEFLGSIGEPVLMGLEELLPELSEAVLAYQPDLAVCTHPPFLCRILHALAKDRRLGVVGFFGGSIESMVQSDELVDWVTEFHAMSQLPNVLFTTTSAFLSVKIFSATGVVARAVPAFGVAADMVYNPTRQEVLVWKTSTHCCNNYPDFFAYIAVVAQQAGLPYEFEHLKVLRSMKQADYETLASFQAVVLFPYDLTLFSFYDMYHAAIPIFAPDKLSSTHYMWRGAVSAPRYSDLEQERIAIRPGWPTDWEGLKEKMNLTDFEDMGLNLHPRFTGTDVRTRLFWSQAVEVYYYPHAQYFESAGDLVHLLSTAKFSTISAEMQRFDRTNLQNAAKFWRAALLNVLSGKSA